MCHVILIPNRLWRVEGVHPLIIPLIVNTFNGLGWVGRNAFLFHDKPTRKSTYVHTDAHVRVHTHRHVQTTDCVYVYEV